MTRRRGFTLLELLVAMAVTVVLIVILGSIASGILRNYRQIDETVRLQADASAALGMIASDLQALAVDVRQIDVLEGQPETVNGVDFTWLMGLARTFDNPGSAMPQSFGELRAFSYKVAYADPSGGSSSVYALYRILLPTGRTRNDVLAVLLANPAQGLAQGYWNAHATTSPDDYLVANVVRFDIAWTYETGAGGTPLEQITPAATDIRYRRDRITVGTPVTNAKLIKATITLTLLPESAVRQLNGSVPSAALIATKGRSFSRDVTFGMP